MCVCVFVCSTLVVELLLLSYGHPKGLKSTKLWISKKQTKVCLFCLSMAILSGYVFCLKAKLFGPKSADLGNRRLVEMNEWMGAHASKVFPEHVEDAHRRRMMFQATPHVVDGLISQVCAMCSCQFPWYHR